MERRELMCEEIYDSDLLNEYIAGQRPPSTQRRKVPLVFDCPVKCGGRLKKLLLFLTTEQGLFVHGKCNECGAYGEKEIPINQLLADAPTIGRVQ